MPDDQPTRTEAPARNRARTSCLLGSKDRRVDQGATKNRSDLLRACERDQMIHRDSLLVVELWASGSILNPGDLPGGVEVVLVVALPPEQLPWGVTPPVLRAFIKGHRLDTKAIVVHARPAGRPVCTRGLPRAARVWTTDGADHGQLDALIDPKSHGLQVSSFNGVNASDREREAAVSRQFLVDAVANYWDREWRREHRGNGQTPEQLLWQALRGHLELSGDIDPN